MIGRSNRSRGICDGVLYANTGEKEAAFLRRIKMGSYSETRELIQFLAHLGKIQGKPVKNETIKQGRANVTVTVVVPDVAALHAACMEEKWVTSLKSLRDLVAVKDAHDE
jgi:hypothetical protein